MAETRIIRAMSIPTMVRMRASTCWLIRSISFTSFRNPFLWIVVTSQSLRRTPSTQSSPRPPRGRTLDIPGSCLYMWIFSNDSGFGTADRRHTQYAVNIPSHFGMDWSYWEANTDPKFHDTNSSIQQDINGGKPTWPDEDQMHHFAADFAAELASPSSGDFALEYALRHTGDWPGTKNPGDFDLGVVGWDVGRNYEDVPRIRGPR